MNATQKKKLDSLPRREATFIEPMECALVPNVPDGPQWIYEVKLDGYRAIAVKSGGKLSLLSRRRKSFNRQFAPVADALVDLPEETVIDGEIVALDDKGRPNFNFIQHSRSTVSRIHYFVFDLLVYKNRDLTRLALIERRSIMQSELRFRSPRIRIADYFETSAAGMVSAVRQQGLEGVVAKRKDSSYEPGQRTGSWTKYRVNRGQEFVIGGYLPSRTPSLCRGDSGYRYRYGNSTRGTHRRLDLFGCFDDTERLTVLSKSFGQEFQGEKTAQLRILKRKAVVRSLVGA